MAEQTQDNNLAPLPMHNRTSENDVSEPLDFSTKRVKNGEIDEKFPSPSHQITMSRRNSPPSYLCQSPNERISPSQMSNYRESTNHAVRGNLYSPDLLQAPHIDSSWPATPAAAVSSHHMNFNFGEMSNAEVPLPSVSIFSAPNDQQPKPQNRPAANVLNAAAIASHLRANPFLLSTLTLAARNHLENASRTTPIHNRDTSLSAHSSLPALSGAPPPFPFPLPVHPPTGGCFPLFSPLSLSNISQVEAEIAQESDKAYELYKLDAVAKVSHQTKSRKRHQSNACPSSSTNHEEERGNYRSSDEEQNCSKKSSKDPAYRERRRKNNAAAKRSRDLRRAKEDETAIRASFLEQENFKLRHELATIRDRTERQLNYLALSA